MSQDSRSSGCGRKATMLDNEYAVWYTTVVGEDEGI